MASEVL
jgi:hypothetical protein